MAAPPEVTVVLPTRNRWSSIGATLAGILRQEDVELELIVVDDGSDVEAPADVTALADERVRVVRSRSRHGVAAARNAGVELAGARWIAFSDDDDLWSPRKLRKQLDAVAAENAAFGYGGAVVVDGELRVLAAYRPPDPATLARRLLVVNSLPAGGSNVLARTDVLRSLGGFDAEFFQLDDWDMWIRLADHERAAACPETVVAYVHHGSNRLLGEGPDLMGEFRQLARKHAERARRHGVEFDGVHFSRWAAQAHRRAGRRRLAVRTYLRGAVAYRSPGNVLRATGTVLGERRMARLAPPIPGAERDPAPLEPAWLDLYRGHSDRLR
jgi:glycosyltransferase involved in cell wall biosynthesis